MIPAIVVGAAVGAILGVHVARDDGERWWKQAAFGLMGAALGGLAYPIYLLFFGGNCDLGIGAGPLC